MAGFSVDIASLRQVGSHTLAAGHILSSKIGGAATLASAATSMHGSQSGPLLTSTAQQWEQHAERLAALVRSDGDRILQAAEMYDGADNDATSGFQQMLDDLDLSGEMNWPEVLVP